MSWNNTSHKYIILSSAAFFSALIFFVLFNQMVVVSVPSVGQGASNPTAVIQKKQVTYYYYHGDKWKAEKQEMLWHESKEKNIFQLINAWLALLDEERIITKKTTLQSALITTSGCVYLSFDHNILSKEETIFKKWMLLEGLLKTISSNDIAVQEAQFLVQHQPLQDAHLDFSCPWPIHGFMK